MAKEIAKVGLAPYNKGIEKKEESRMLRMGHGKEVVYLYYFKRDRRDYEADGFETWPCKVGFSHHLATSRVANQVKTASPEWPTMGLEVYTDDGFLLEQALHAILRLYHREITNATGTEWFLTSPEEVAGLCKLLRREV